VSSTELGVLRESVLGLFAARNPDKRRKMEQNTFSIQFRLAICFQVQEKQLVAVFKVQNKSVIW
jgi:hypothetical protein